MRDINGPLKEFSLFAAAGVVAALSWTLTYKSLHEQSGLPMEQDSFDVMGRVSILLASAALMLPSAKKWWAAFDADPLPPSNRARSAVFLPMPRPRPAPAAPVLGPALAPAVIEDQASRLRSCGD